ncbi:MAG: UDP-N-acetylmuramoyl-L-alanine--D-glutamate ligase [Puniceicoccales bacterium]|nr:UDP-N-acetylmuramoyl-L-alanine--D-glutamate ligase [Puniceicoccales bacterium]
MNTPQSIAARLAKPVAIFGTGVSGLAAARLVESAGGVPTLYDERGSGDICRSFGADEAARHELAIYSPGFPQRHPWLLAARRAGVLCLGELDFASLFWKSPIVAVTGTNGKTTLTEFLVFAHKRAGREAVATGNIGYPLSRIFELGGNRMPLPVCEVSSFQSEDLRHFAPTALLWTNFAEDHLNRHGDLETYFRAKYKLVERLAGRRLIVGESVAEFAKKFGLPLPAFTEVATRAEVAGKTPPDSVFATFPQRENYALARRYWLAEGLPERALEEAAQVFAPAGHRLEKVAVCDGVTYWDDSKATNFHAVLAALEALRGDVCWIGGGRSKGGDLAAFVEKVAARAKAVFLIGETAPELFVCFQEKGVQGAVFKKLPDAVRAARAVAKSGDSVLLSPGFASFDMFRDYAERGLIFEQTVRAFRETR